MEEKKIPVTLITGFLGSGKTTLVNHILKEFKDEIKPALIENEFGEIGIDSELIKDPNELIMEMNEGCLCCNVRGDLLLALGKLLEEKDTFDHLLIEATGMANPGPVIESFMGEGPIAQSYQMDTVITLIDTPHFQENHKQFGEKGQESEFLTQISFGNLLLLNKTEGLSEKELDEIEGLLQSLNPSAEIIRTNYGKIPKEKVFGGEFYNIKNLEGTLDEKQREKESHQHHHSPEITSHSFKFSGELDPQLFEAFLSFTFMQNRNRLYRGKGILHISGQPKKVLFQSVYAKVEFDLGRDWPEEEEPQNKIVFIGKNLRPETLEKGMKNCLKKPK